MHAKLAEILNEKRSEIERLKTTWNSSKRDVPEDRRDFKNALTRAEGTSLIAEIKFGSPSAGTIREISDPVSIGKAYEAAGAAAISLLTDRKFFKGDIQNLPVLKKTVGLPVLRKDFILDEIQIRESAAYGADAILLIARILATRQLKDLLHAAHNYGMAVLTEVHDLADLEKALACDAEIIGINNRDLDTFKIDLNTTFELAPRIPKGRVVIGESGICSAKDMNALKELNIDGALVGSALMATAKPGQLAADLVAAGHH